MELKVWKISKILQTGSCFGMIVTAILLSWQDLRTRYVSARALLAFTLFTLINTILTPVSYWFRSIAGATASGLFMIAASKTSRHLSGQEMIGNGDVWFAFATGLAAQGLLNAFNMLALAFFLALLPAIHKIIRHLCGKVTKKTNVIDDEKFDIRSIRDIARYEIPFFPFLALSLFIIRVKTES